MTEKKNKRNVDSRIALQEKARQAIIDFINFEDETSQIWPWAISAEELVLSEVTLQKIAKALQPDETGDYDTDEVYDAISHIAGVNPKPQ